MIINRTNIDGCVHLVNKNFSDNRGVFCEFFRSSNFAFKNPQINYSHSHKNVLRGIHRTPYAKLVTCVYGSVHDVCVDLRIDSPTYGKYFSIILSSNHFNSILIPPYCGHGFLALENSIVLYCQGDEYDSKQDQTYCYKSFGIDWPITQDILISDKDSAICEDII